MKIKIIQKIKYNIFGNVSIKIRPVACQQFSEFSMPIIVDSRSISYNLEGDNAIVR